MASHNRRRLFAILSARVVLVLGRVKEDIKIYGLGRVGKGNVELEPFGGREVAGVDRGRRGGLKRLVGGGDLGWVGGRVGSKVEGDERGGFGIRGAGEEDGGRGERGDVGGGNVGVGR
jgi:hypothetical protein